MGQRIKIACIAKLFELVKWNFWKSEMRGI